MQTINANTKRGAALVAAYNRSNNFTLSDCYGRFSHEKARAEKDCREKMTRENGHGFTITSYNTFGFSCGWKTADGLRIETPCNSYLVK